MSWLGRFLGDMAGTLYPGAKALVEKYVDRVIDALIDASRQFVDSWQRSSPAASQSPEAAAKVQRSKAEDLAEEERDLGAKFRRDGKRTSAESDRLEEIRAAREQLREEIKVTSAVQAAQDMAASDNLVQAPGTREELASQVGLLSTKECPTCRGVMTLNVGPFSASGGQKFHWRCTALRPIRCPDLWLKDSELSNSTSVREPIADLDLGAEARKAWNEPSVIARTAARVRGHLGDEDTAVMCPCHLLPMKLLPIANSKGLLLDSYQYTCLAVDENGRGCSHTVPLASFGQVTSMLHRAEGRGIL